MNKNATAIGDATVVATSPGAVYDDFALDGHDHAFLATGSGNTVRIRGKWSLLGHSTGQSLPGRRVWLLGEG